MSINSQLFQLVVLKVGVAAVFLFNKPLNKNWVLGIFFFFLEKNALEKIEHSLFVFIQNPFNKGF